MSRRLLNRGRYRNAYFQILCILLLTTENKAKGSIELLSRIAWDFFKKFRFKLYAYFII